MKQMNYYGNSWKRGLRPVSTILTHCELCFTLNSLTAFTRWRNRGNKVGFGEDLIPWDGTMGQGKGPVHHWLRNLGVNRQHRGKRGHWPSRWGEGPGTAHGYQHCLCVTGWGGETNCPLDHPTPSKQRACSSPRRRGLRTKEASQEVWHVLSTPSCGKGGRHSIIVSHTGFNMPERILCLLKIKKNSQLWKGMYNHFCRVPFRSSLQSLPCYVLFPAQCDLRNILTQWAPWTFLFLGKLSFF